MTIAAAYLTSDGVVVGADSTVTVKSQKTGVALQSLSHGQKVYEIGERSRFGLCSWGDGSVAGTSHRTIAGLLGDFLQSRPTASTVDVANRLCELLEELAHHVPTDVGYFVGGYDMPARTPALMFVARAGAIRECRSLPKGFYFGGETGYFRRSHHGVDPLVQSGLVAALQKRLNTLPPEEVEKLARESLAEATQPLMLQGYDDLPIRDAIDFVHTYLHLTVKMEKFRFKVPPTCGGPIEVAFITTDRFFRWVRHKGFDTAILEHENA